MNISYSEITLLGVTIAVGVFVLQWGAKHILDKAFLPWLLDIWAKRGKQSAWKAANKMGAELIYIRNIYTSPQKTTAYIGSRVVRLLASCIAIALVGGCGMLVGVTFGYLTDGTSVDYTLKEALSPVLNTPKVAAIVTFYLIMTTVLIFLFGMYAKIKVTLFEINQILHFSYFREMRINRIEKILIGAKQESAEISAFLDKIRKQSGENTVFD